MQKHALPRRHFIRMATLASGSILLLPGCSTRPADSYRHFFTETEASLMDALAEQIIPADKWPGRKDAGVTHFIDINKAIHPVSGNLPERAGTHTTNL